MSPALSPAPLPPTQGVIILPRTRENHEYYGTASATPQEILSGKVGISPPKPEVEFLHGIIAKAQAGGEAWGVPPKSEFQLFVSGRVCLFGEHSDWAGAYRVHNHEIVPGATIVCGTEHEGLYATVRKRSDHKLVLRSVLDNGEARGTDMGWAPEAFAPVAVLRFRLVRPTTRLRVLRSFPATPVETHDPSEIGQTNRIFSAPQVMGPVEFPMEKNALMHEAQKGGFWGYACGVASKVVSMFDVAGLEIDNYRTTLPVKKGLSSSAAMCVLVARAFRCDGRERETCRGGAPCCPPLASARDALDIPMAFEPTQAWNRLTTAVAL